MVPVVNENDTVSVAEIKFGDNDTLAALVSCLVSADMCVTLSDIDGLYTANPSIDPDARFIPRRGEDWSRRLSAPRAIRPPRWVRAA